MKNEVTDYEGVKAFNIARVSDPRQTDALPAQKLRLDAYTNRLKLNSEYYAFDETAYKEDRQKFREIVDNIKKYPNFCIVVFDKIDRFTRDASSDIVQSMKGLVKEGKIELHFPSDNLIYQKNSPASDKTRLGMGMVFGEYYSSAISDNVKRRQEQKVSVGEFPGKAPVGYKNINITDVNGNVISKDIVPDPVRSKYIVKAYEMRLDGKSFRTIAKQLKEDGLRANTKGQGVVSQSQIQTMLMNPFYYGVMRYNGKEYPHKYQAIIEKRLFDKVQFLNEERNNNSHKTLTRQVFTFSGVVRCATCGCSYSSYEKKGRVYMRCSKARRDTIDCNQPPVPEAELLPQVDDLLKRLSISEGIVNQVLDILKGEHDNIQLFYRNAIKETKDKVDIIDKRLETLYEDRLDGRITTPDYDKYVTKYKAEKEELEYRLVEYTNNDKSFILTATHLLELAQNARSIFQSSQPAQKNKILKALLANCQINEKRLQLNLLKPFSVLIDSTLSQNWLPGSDSNRRPSDYTYPL
jgi:site-specific DNA recombinase